MRGKWEFLIKSILIPFLKCLLKAEIKINITLVRGYFMLHILFKKETD